MVFFIPTVLHQRPRYYIWLALRARDVFFPTPWRPQPELCCAGWPEQGYSPKARISGNWIQRVYKGRVAPLAKRIYHLNKSAGEEMVDKASPRRWSCQITIPVLSQTSTLVKTNDCMCYCSGDKRKSRGWSDRKDLLTDQAVGPCLVRQVWSKGLQDLE
jgi:hypothetical protein